jgi:hypothetical protein
MGHEFSERSDMYVAPGQEETGLSYDPGRPISEQITEDVQRNNPEQNKPSVDEAIAGLKSARDFYDNTYGVGSDEAASLQRQIDALNKEGL